MPPLSPAHPEIAGRSRVTPTAFSSLPLERVSMLRETCSAAADTMLYRQQQHGGKGEQPHKDSGGQLW
jgi:hypothetical protein